jgi:hypothetical protein
MLSYDDSAQLMRDATFVSRVKVACMHYAAYILGEDAGVPAHSTRVRWAQQVMSSPDGVAAQVTPPTVMDANVQSQGAAIIDADLQTAVETTI